VSTRAARVYSRLSIRKQNSGALEDFSTPIKKFIGIKKKLKVPPPF
jgi:hypothetical protein